MIDLHAHSTFSDGSFTPAELVSEAAKMSLTAIALTDHNTVEGIGQFLSEAEKQGINAVSGVEISTDYNGKELHIVGLFIDGSSFDEIKNATASANARKRQSNLELIEKLNSKFGCDISLEKLESENAGLINRVQIANELMKRGIISSVKEGFDTVLSEKNGLYVPAKRENSLSVIKMLRDLKIIPILAHPFLNLKQDELLTFLPEAKNSGLIGMECEYSRFTPEQTAAAKEIAEHFGLLCSGGSDFHGVNKPDIRLGSGTGGLNVPDIYYYNLRDKKETL